MRQPDGKIMKGPNFKPPVFRDLIKRIGSPTDNTTEKYWSMSNTVLITNMINQVKEFHTMFGHPIGMLRWDREEGPPGGFTKERITFGAQGEAATPCFIPQWEEER